MRILPYGQCFRTLGAPLGQDVHAWSSQNGTTIVLALWNDAFDLTTDPPSHSAFDPAGHQPWMDMARNIERLSHLSYAVEYCNSQVKAFVSVAMDQDTKTEVAASVYIPNLTLKLTKLDRKTGEFLADVISPDRETLRKALSLLQPR